METITTLKSLPSLSMHANKPVTSFDHLALLEIRVATVVNAEEALTRKPTFRLTLDFGQQIGTRISCGAYRHYRRDELVGRQVLAVINLGTKNMGPEKSEALVLGVPDNEGRAIIISPERPVPLGGEIF